MIYEYPGASEPIRQGDIFIGLPRVEISLSQIPVVEGDQNPVIRRWRELAAAEEPVAAVLAVRPVAAIVATQDCDAVRAPDITLCEIRPFHHVCSDSTNVTSVKRWVDILTRQSRVNLKWFYLPPDVRVGFRHRMCVDFLATLRVRRTELEEHRDLRMGRLNAVADEHFREKIGEFFRRYPFDEWYALNRDELQEYRGKYPEAEPFPWQEAQSSASGNPAAT